MYEPFFFVQELRAEGVSQGNLIGKATRQTTLPAAPAVVGRERLPGVMRGLRQGGLLRKATRWRGRSKRQRQLFTFP
jgi:hypothetical protein